MSLTSLMRWRFDERRTLGAEHTVTIGGTRRVLRVSPREHDYQWVEAEVTASVELGALVHAMREDPAWASLRGLTVDLVGSAALNAAMVSEATTASGASVERAHLELRRGTKLFVPVPRLLELPAMSVAPTTGGAPSVATVMLDPSWMWQLIRFYLEPITEMTAELRMLSDDLDAAFTAVARPLWPIAAQDHLLRVLGEEMAAGRVALEEGAPAKLQRLRTSLGTLATTGSTYLTERLARAHDGQIAHRLVVAHRVLHLLDSEDEGATQGFRTLLRRLWASPDQLVLVGGRRVSARSLAATAIFSACDQVVRVPELANAMLDRIAVAMDKIPTNSPQPSSERDVVSATVASFAPDAGATWMLAVSTFTKLHGSLPGPESLAGCLLKVVTIWAGRAARPAEAQKWVGWMQKVLLLHGPGLGAVDVRGVTRNVTRELDELHDLLGRIAAGERAQLDAARAKLGDLGDVLDDHFQSGTLWRASLGILAVVSLHEALNQQQESSKKGDLVGEAVAWVNVAGSSTTVALAFERAGTEAPIANKFLVVVSVVNAVYGLGNAIAHESDDWREYAQSVADLVALSPNPLVAGIGIAFSVGLSISRHFYPAGGDTMEPATSRLLGAQLGPIRTLVEREVKRTLKRDITHPHELEREREAAATRLVMLRARAEQRGERPPAAPRRPPGADALEAFEAAMIRHSEAIDREVLASVPRSSILALEHAGLSRRTLQSLTITPEASMPDRPLPPPVRLPAGTRVPGHSR